MSDKTIKLISKTVCVTCRASDGIVVSVEAPECEASRLEDIYHVDVEELYTRAPELRDGGMTGLSYAGHSVVAENGVPTYRHMQRVTMKPQATPVGV